MIALTPEKLTLLGRLRPHLQGTTSGRLHDVSPPEYQLHPSNSVGAQFLYHAPRLTQTFAN